MTKSTEKILIGLIRLLIVLILAATFVMLYPPARFSALALMGRNSGCTVKMVADTLQKLDRQKDIARRVKRSMRLKGEDGPLRLWATDRGDFWVPARTQHNLPILLAEQEMQLYGTGRHAVRPGDIVLDCGAHVGAFTRKALTAGAELVVSIEISPDNLRCLQRNFAREIQEGHVIVYPKGVWDNEDCLTLRTRGGTSLDDSVVVEGGDFVESGRVPLTTIDRLVSELNLPRVDFIKLDVEGAEEKAVVGAKQTLTRYHPRLSVSSETFVTDAAKLPVQVRAGWPGYQVERGYCTEINVRVLPFILYFD